jgi:uncharacterized protein
MVLIALYNKFFRFILPPWLFSRQWRRILRFAAVAWLGHYMLRQAKHAELYMHPKLQKAMSKWREEQVDGTIIRLLKATGKLILHARLALGFATIETETEHKLTATAAAAAAADTSTSTGGGQITIDVDDEPEAIFGVPIEERLLRAQQNALRHRREGHEPDSQSHGHSHNHDHNHNHNHDLDHSQSDFKTLHGHRTGADQGNTTPRQGAETDTTTDQTTHIRWHRVATADRQHGAAPTDRDHDNRDDDDDHDHDHNRDGGTEYLSALHTSQEVADIEQRAELTLAMLTRTPQVAKRTYYPFVLNFGMLQTVLSLVPFHNLPMPPGNMYGQKVPTMQQFELSAPDGERLVLDVLEHKSVPREAPVVVIFPGNEGDSTAPYLQSIVREIYNKRWRVAFYVRRGCGKNKLQASHKPQLYSDEDDIEVALSFIRNRYPSASMLGLGYSLGGNLLSRYLGVKGQIGEPCVLDCAVILGNPFNMCGVSYYMKYGSKIVDVVFLGMLKKMVRANEERIRDAGVDVDAILASQTCRELFRRYHFAAHKRDDWNTMDEMLIHGSSCYYVKYIKTPTLFLHCADDPVCPPALCPFEAFEENPSIVLAITTSGGHHAFLPWNLIGRKWSDRSIMQWFQAYMEVFQNV